MQGHRRKSLKNPRVVRRPQATILKLDRASLEVRTPNCDRAKGEPLARWSMTPNGLLKQMFMYSWMGAILCVARKEESMSLIPTVNT